MDKNDRDYTNGEITVHWKPSACVHSTICYNRLRSVFDPVKRPWVNMDGAPTDKIIDIVNQCPTDALTFTRNDATELEKNTEDKTESVTEESATKIQIMENGPAIVSGSFLITDIDGNSLAKADTLALCRCGHSSSMPFCDGTHNNIGFKEKRDK
ncbi:MAG: (4Fe-4S)-binding protein [Bacteroidales bacterium]|nr:(4Fe-4S)-binding protein [Bacteroidales bacterium]